jgi:hypothetical protein
MYTVRDARGQTGLATFASHERARTHRQVQFQQPRGRPALPLLARAKHPETGLFTFYQERAASQVHLWNYIQLPRLMRSE